jgi:hypothetical protein
VRIDGVLQSESGVIHVIARTITDLTPWLAALSESMPLAPSLAHADEVRRPVREGRHAKHPRAQFAQLVREMPELAADYERIARESAARKVLPKGRNFH